MKTAVARKSFAVSTEMEEIDRLGRLKQQITELTHEHDKLEKKLRRKLGVRSGLFFRLNVFVGATKVFNYTKARRAMGAVAFDKCWKEVEYRSSRLTKLRE